MLTAILIILEPEPHVRDIVPRFRRLDPFGIGVQFEPDIEDQPKKKRIIEAFFTLSDAVRQSALVKLVEELLEAENYDVTSAGTSNPYLVSVSSMSISEGHFELIISASIISFLLIKSFC